MEKYHTKAHNVTGRVGWSAGCVDPSFFRHTRVWRVVLRPRGRVKPSTNTQRLSKIRTRTRRETSKAGAQASRLAAVLPPAKRAGKLINLSGLKGTSRQQSGKPFLFPVDAGKIEPALPGSPLLHRWISVEGRESSAHVLLNPSTTAEKKGARTFVQTKISTRFPRDRIKRQGPHT